MATVGAVESSVETPSPTTVGDEAEPSAETSTVTVVPATATVPLRSGRVADQEARTEVNRPVSVRVAGIGLEAPVIAVGVDENNQFAVPSAETVGWYEFSSQPGSPGASVLAAHVDYGGKAGAFFDLSNVLPGETLEVELTDGSVIRYEVVGNTQYDKTDLPAGELFRKDGPSVLQLITCGGQFDPSKRSYEANVVVSAVPTST